MSIFQWIKNKMSSNMENDRLKDLKVKCPDCEKVYTGIEAYDQFYICPECGAYMKIGALERISMITDKDTFEVWFDEIEDSNPLGDETYAEKLEKARDTSGVSEAVIVGRAKIEGEDVVLGVCDASFIMGSMGYVMGERITRAFEEATKLRLPVIMFCCSGGARMQEGIISLMQMEKTSAAIKRHSDAGLFYCSILTDPTMGGVTASFATLGDVILAEPGARIGFAGPRVIRQTIGHELPEGFQRAEFLLEHGMVDQVVERKHMKELLSFLIKVNKAEKQNFHIAQPTENWNKLEEAEAFSEKTPWEKVKLCRTNDRLTSLEYISEIFENFEEFHGDRYYDDDRALIGGVGFLDEQPVTILAELRGRTMAECMERNFGMPMPDGYRKAVRLMKQAEKFHRPIISFISTPGAFCGVDAEERGQGEAIARSIMEMSALKVPVLCILIGEGGSGGALATAVGNQVWMMEHSTYAILSPEGYSSILWKTNDRAPEAAEIMKITAQDLKQMQIIDRIVPEFGGATKENLVQITDYIKNGIRQFLITYGKMTPEEIAEDRYQRFRRF